MYDLIIVGAGPSGMSAAIYAKRAGLNVLLLEGNNIGGQVSSAHIIENYPGFKQISGFDLVMNMYNQVEDLGVEIIFEKVINIINLNVIKNIKEVITEDNTYQCRAVILATGVIPRKLQLENEENLIGKGISYCAICDGAFYIDKDVAIVGGGNSAAMEASYLATYCKSVTMLQDLDSLTCDESSKKQVMNNKKIKVLTSCKVVRLIGDESLTDIEVIHNGVNKTIAVDGLFVSIGKIPQNEAFSSICKLNKQGYIVTDESLCLEKEGIFAAGDCREKTIRQITTATSDGAIAAINASNYIKSL